MDYFEDFESELPADEVPIYPVATINLEVADLDPFNSGSLPRVILVRERGEDGAGLYATYNGFPPNLQVGDLVECWFDDNDTIMRVSGASGDSGVVAYSYDNLTDTPASKTGHYHKVPAVDQGQNAHEYQYRLDYQGAWQDKEYPPMVMVTRNGYTSISNKTTTDQPDPQIIDPAEYLLPDDITSDPNWTTLNYTGTVWFGMFIEVTGESWNAVEVRFWIFDTSGDTTYTLFWENDLTGELSQVLQVNGDVLPSPGWLTLGVNTGFVVPGDKFVIWVMTQTNSATTQFSGFWDYTSSNQATIPVDGQFHRRLNRDTIFVSKTDDDGTDRSADFANIIIGTIITSTEGADYSVTGITDNGSWMEFDIVGINPLLSGRQNFTFDIPVPAATPFGYITDFFVSTPSEYALLQGAFAVDTGAPVLNNNGYPVEAKWQRWQQSEDWDIIALG